MAEEREIKIPVGTGVKPVVEAVDELTVEADTKIGEIVAAEA